MDLNKLTDKAQDAVLAAQALANAEGPALIQPAHMLLALLRQADGVVPAVVAGAGVNAHDLAEEVSRDLERVPKGSRTSVCCATVQSQPNYPVLRCSAVRCFHPQ